MTTIYLMWGGLFAVCALGLIKTIDSACREAFRRGENSGFLQGVRSERRFYERA